VKDDRGAILCQLNVAFDREAGVDRGARRAKGVFDYARPRYYAIRDGRSDVRVKR